MQEPDSNKEFTPGQYVRVRSDEDEPWEDVRIYVEKQGSLHYVTKAGAVRYADGDSTEGFLFCKTWVPETNEIVLYIMLSGYVPGIIEAIGERRFRVFLCHENYSIMPKLDKLIPYYLPPFKPAPHE